MRKVHAYVVLGLALAVTAGWSLTAAAQMASANYSIPADVIGGGGNTMSSPNYTLSSTLGQPSPLGDASSAGYENHPGFWQPDSVVVDSDGDGLTDDEEINTYFTNPNDPDSDHDGLSDYMEVITRPCLDPLDEDSDHDGLSDGDTAGGGPGEDANNDGIIDPTESDACDSDSDDDGLSDGDEVLIYGTLTYDWDSDDDYLPDKFEADNQSGHPLGNLDPMDNADGPVDYDGDGNDNQHEYWNGSSVWTDDPMPEPGYTVGCYYWGKSDSGPYVQPQDIGKIQAAYVGAVVDYSDILPSQFDPLDLDRSSFSDPPDISLCQYMYAEASRPGGYPSTPLSLEVVYFPPADVTIGNTTHITVSVHAQGPGTELFSSGFGVEFWVESGSATLMGGEGVNTKLGHAGNRYDISMDSAGGARANIVVRVDGPGPITVNARVPACGRAPLGRWCAEVPLPAAVTITTP